MKPGNCRWATKKKQQRNTSANVNITHAGKTQCVAAWAEETGIPYHTIRMRLRYGWPVSKALAQSITPPNRKRAMKGGG